MKLYVTNADYNKVKKSFLNFRSFSVINVQDIVQSFNYTEDELDEYASFIINDEIKSILNDSISKKKFFNIMYVNSNLDIEIIENLKEFAKHESNIEKTIFIDDDKKSHVNLYPLFDEVIFFPESKRVRIIQCETIKNPLFYWINNRPVPENVI